MRNVLKNWKFGDKFTNAINQIYSTQTITIRINNEMTDEFPVQKGTRHVSLLSPLLFVTVLQVLLEIQRDKQWRHQD